MSIAEQDALLPLTIGAVRRLRPFPHVRIPQILSERAAANALEWMRVEPRWRLRQESFYEQYEIELRYDAPPPHLAALTSDVFLDAMRAIFHRGFRMSEPLALAGISAHKLLPGQAIGVHNDMLPDGETHRALIQLNDGWRPEYGGALQLFEGRSQPPAEMVTPVHGSGFLFEISPLSWHAVEAIKGGERYTLVYDFKCERRNLFNRHEALNF